VKVNRILATCITLEYCNRGTNYAFFMSHYLSY